jgi:hypothetical protein
LIPQGAPKSTAHLEVHPGTGADSLDEDGGSEAHKVRQITHAIRLGQNLTVVIHGQYQSSGQKQEVQFQYTFDETTASEDIYQPLLREVEAFGALCNFYHGVELLRSCYWPKRGFREKS